MLKFSGMEDFSGAVNGNFTSISCRFLISTPAIALMAMYEKLLLFTLWSALSSRMVSLNWSLSFR